MKSEIAQILGSVCKELFSVDEQIVLTRPDEQFGDYSSNIALKLSKTLSKPPREIAETIADKLREQAAEKIANIQIAGPGFINITMSDTTLQKSLLDKPEQTLRGKVIVAEYSDPNPFKVLHAGHLYTTITGDSITRVLEKAGARVTRINYGGDVGLHVAKTVWAVINHMGGEYPEKLNEIDESLRLEWLSDRYVEGNTAYEDDDQAKLAITEINKKVYEIHTSGDHDSSFARIYWACRTWSYDGFNELYKQLQVIQFDRTIAESEVTEPGLSLVRKGRDEGVFVESDGAIVFNGEEFDLHTRVFINSRGLPTYEAKELGLAAIKWQDYNFDKSIIITGNDIVEYMKVVLKSLEHFYPEVVRRSTHLTHGLIKLPGGEKMSSRMGNILRASDILQKATEANKKLSGDENHETVLGAVKYSLLKSRMGGDIIYDPEQSVSLEGNSGPYLQYAHARARSILRKAQKENREELSEDLNQDERSLVRKITEFNEVFETAVNELLPHAICTYLYELAQIFNHFYEHNRIIGDERESFRLGLISYYASTLKEGLDLLGIAAPDKM
ncbi:MAG: arginine--tRNA ligase [Candidatus Saccharimonadales bacterium]